MTQSTYRNFFSDNELIKQVYSIPKKTGSMGYDAWGFNKVKAANTASFIKWLYEYYFRTEAFGLENIPKEGRVLIIANHSGQLPLDGLLIGYSMLTNPHAPRAPRPMIERFFPTIPYIGNLLNSMGAVIGDPKNCIKMLEHEEPILVFPEGVRGSGKPFSKRYQLQRFGHGFVQLAIKHKVPIIPVGVVGCEETMPSLGNFTPLAKLLGVPYIPLTLPAVLPAKVMLNFGEPMTLNTTDSEDTPSIAHDVERVKDAIRRLIDKGLEQRNGVFFNG